MSLTVPRIQPVEEKDWTAVERELLSPLKAERGSVPNIYATLARHPKLFMSRLNFGRYIQRDSKLPARDRELVILRIAWLSRGEYEWSVHTTVGLQNGLTKEDIRRIASGPQARGWSAFDAALLRSADGLYQNTFIRDETWNKLMKRYDAHQIMDLVMSSEERELLTPFKQQRGYVMNVYGTLTRHPQMFRPWLGFARYILRESTLPAREREMLICRVAWLTSGEYEWAAHKTLGKDAGLTNAEVIQLSEGPAAAAWAPFDATIVRAVDELHYDAFISDPTWTALATRFARAN